MSIDYKKLENAPRLLLDVELKPLQGDRFQPTGFPDLGAARYTAPDGKEMLIIESSQSVANRMELACWNEPNEDVIEELNNLPYIKVVGENGKMLTSSILEAHRLSSPYILEGQDKTVYESLKEELAQFEIGAVNLIKLAQILLKYDANALLHGIFLAKKDLAGGRLRLPRVISGFIEGSGVGTVASGGAKLDHVNPKGDTNKGFGNVIYPRTEFTAEKITAYFNIDLALLRNYGFSDNAYKLLIALALFKIRRFLSTGLRLRTACDLEPISDEFNVKRPKDGFTIPSETELLNECQELIASCKDHFANPPVTEVQWKK